MSEHWLNFILNKTRKPSERWRIVNGGMGYSGDIEESPQRSLRIVKGGKSRGDSDRYATELSLHAFFTGSFNGINAPDSVKKECYRMVSCQQIH